MCASLKVQQNSVIIEFALAAQKLGFCPMFIYHPEKFKQVFVLDVMFRPYNQGHLCQPLNNDFFFAIFFQFFFLILNKIANRDISSQHGKTNRLFYPLMPGRLPHVCVHFSLDLFQNTSRFIHRGQPFSFSISFYCYLSFFDRLLLWYEEMIFIRPFFFLSLFRQTQT